MFVNAVEIATKAAFPIFRNQQLPGNQQSWMVAGAGFFISPQGHFASVAHLFDSAGPGVKFLYLGQVPETVVNPPIKIQEIARDDDRDVYIGKIDITPAAYFSLSLEDAPLGRSVCIVGYPLAQLAPNADGGLEVGGARRYIQPSFVLDHGISRAISDSGRTREHHGFLVRDVGLFGMSGGPVFDINGIVLGIQGSVTPPRISEGGGRKITVENAQAIKSSIIIELARDNNVPVQVVEPPAQAIES